MKKNPFDLYTLEYEEWFKENPLTFQSEVLALQQLLPKSKNGIEIGIGSGIFARALGIKSGIDPSENMLDIARKRNLTVENAYAERLPYPDQSFDFALFITSICFIEHPEKAMKEAWRIIKTGGEVIIAFIDKQSTLGQQLIADKEDSKFYRTANFFSVPEINALLTRSNFEVSTCVQTLMNPTSKKIEKPVKSFGKGGFVVVKGLKKEAQTTPATVNP
jgi:ubiquinone/menaquinone biosynthesis C-methylase UbiE